MKKWECGVPGKSKTLWEGGLFKVDMIFPEGEFAPSFLLDAESFYLTHWQ